MALGERNIVAIHFALGRGPNHIAYTEEEKKGGIALVNVNNRIHLIFGEEYGMHIYSIEKQGTDVEITIPITAGDGIINKGMM